MITSATLVAIALLMLFELRLSRRNERALKARGAVEPRDDVYRWMQLAYPLAFVTPAIEGWLTPRHAAGLRVAGLVLLLAAKGLKYWAVATLGERWTFKVLVPPRSVRTTSGPYRLLSHPNYVAVAGEILGAGWLMGGLWAGLAFTILFACLMLRRIQIEERALS